MANEINRKIAYKRIAQPGSTPASAADIQSGNGNNAGEVKVPVIIEITFKDPVDRGQESTYTVNNAGIAWRDVHVAWVGDKGTADASETPDLSQPIPADCIAVERLDKWRVKDPVDRGQQTQPQPDNKTYDPHGPPFFTTHKKTHLVRYINEPDDMNFVESELIDQINYKDPIERGQQTWYTLQNPSLTNNNIAGLIIDSTTDDQGNQIATVAVDPNAGLADVTEPSDSSNPVDQGTNDAPYRLDPFQNIVRVTGRAIFVAGEDAAFTSGLQGGDYIPNTAHVWWSEDGLKWTQATTPADSLLEVRIRDIIYDQGMWILTGSYTYDIRTYYNIPPYPNLPPYTVVDHLVADYAMYSYNGKDWTMWWKLDGSGDVSLVVNYDSVKNNFTVSSIHSTINGVEFVLLNTLVDPNPLDSNGNQTLFGATSNNYNLPLFDSRFQNVSGITDHGIQSPYSLPSGFSAVRLNRTYYVNEFQWTKDDLTASMVATTGWPAAAWTTSQNFNFGTAFPGGALPVWYAKPGKTPQP